MVRRKLRMEANNVLIIPTVQVRSIFRVLMVFHFRSVLYLDRKLIESGQRLFLTKFMNLIDGISTRVVCRSVLTLVVVFIRILLLIVEALLDLKVENLRFGLRFG
jgi:hypothetical protein